MTLYRLLLRLFPRSFRDRFGDAMADVFADRLRAARQLGVGATTTLVLRTFVDLLQHAAAERAAMRWRAPLGGRSGGIMLSLFDDFGAAVRGLIRRPGFGLAAAAMLALGLGFNTALFAVVRSVVLKPLPYAQADRIVMAWTGRNPDGTGAANSYADYLDWKTRSTSFETLATYNIALGTLTDSGEPEEIGGATVSPEFFGVLGARVLRGRAIEPGDEKIAIDNGRPIVIAYSLWERRFSRDPNIIGRTITLNERPRRVVGILGPDFKHPEPNWDMKAEFWTPLAVNDQMLSNHAFHFLRVVGRLKNGVSVDRARAEMDTIGKRLMADFPVTNTRSVIVSPIRDELMGDTQPLLWMFLGAVSLVLLLAVANVINLLLARASGRMAELSLRTALGATRGRLISQLVCESTVIGLLGGAIGLGLAQLGIVLLIKFGKVNTPGIEDTSLDGAVLLFALGLSAITGAVCGAVPAFRVARGRLLQSSSSQMRGSVGPEAARARRWLVAAEMALAVPLLVGAALLTETLVSMQRVDPGFDASHALQFRVSLTGARYDSSAKEIAFFTQLRDRLSSIPHATAVGMVSSLPLGGLNNTGGSINYVDPTGRPAEIGVGFRSIAGSYFATLGIPLIKGRLFDDVSEADAVIINDIAAREMWGTLDPIGRLVRFGTGADARWLTVVGVVGSFRHEALTRSANAEMFQPYRSNAWSTMTVTLRASGEPTSIATEVRDVVHELDPRLAIVNLAPVSVFVDGQMARPRFGAMCSTVFGMLGLALAAFGTFAVLSLLVAQRTKEIGIRMALGSTPGRVRAMVLRQSLIPALAGCAVGGVAASWLSKALSSQLFGVAAHDPVAFTTAIVLLAVAACLASWWPARQATRINPVIALRAN